MLSFVFQPQRYSLQSYILKFDNRNTSVLFSFNKENINMLMLEIVLHESVKKYRQRLQANKYSSLPFPMAEWEAGSQVNTLLCQVQPRTVFLFGITPAHCKNK